MNPIISAEIASQRSHELLAQAERSRRVRPTLRTPRDRPSVTVPTVRTVPSRRRITFRTWLAAGRL